MRKISPKNLGVSPLSPEERYLKRKIEVTEQDHEEFLAYLEAKRVREEKRNRESAPEQPASAPAQTTDVAPAKLDRRSFLTVVAGTAAVGEAAALGHMAGGTYAVDLNTGRALAWISYWNYGDFNPISHHLCAFPSADPVQGFEWVNSTQGGKNSLIYGIPTNIETPAEGFNIYRVRCDGSQMELMENVSETTGLGLGVHVTIDPKTAERYFVTDGQKDIAALFDRRTSRVIAAATSNGFK